MDGADRIGSIVRRNFVVVGIEHGGRGVDLRLISCDNAPWVRKRCYATIWPYGGTLWQYRR